MQCDAMHYWHPASAGVVWCAGRWLPCGGMLAPQRRRWKRSTAPTARHGPHHTGPPFAADPHPARWNATPGGVSGDAPPRTTNQPTNTNKHEPRTPTQSRRNRPPRPARPSGSRCKAVGLPPVWNAADTLSLENGAAGVSLRRLGGLPPTRGCGRSEAGRYRAATTDTESARASRIRDPRREDWRERSPTRGGTRRRCRQSTRKRNAPPPRVDPSPRAGTQKRVRPWWSSGRRSAREPWHYRMHRPVRCVPSHRSCHRGSNPGGVWSSTNHP
mmetsp:Transcript_8049/g.17903  ORF Transcript_8049/g.17903 Transcript_8049/m.17903 type:complete len:272 (-) Transcript_8049:741-1556(-)